MDFDGARVLPTKYTAAAGLPNVVMTPASLHGKYTVFRHTRSVVEREKINEKNVI